MDLLSTVWESALRFFGYLAPAIAWAAFVLSLWNAAFTWKNWKFRRDRIEPDVAITRIGDKAWLDPTRRDGWWVPVDFEVRNVDTYLRALEAISVQSPRGQIIALSENLWTNSYLDPNFRGLAPEHRANQVFPDEQIRAGDTALVSLFFLVPALEVEAFRKDKGELALRFDFSSSSRTSRRSSIYSRIKKMQLATPIPKAM